MLPLLKSAEFFEVIELSIVGELVGAVFHPAFADFYLRIITPDLVCSLDYFQGLKIIVSVLFREQTKGDSLHCATEKYVAVETLNPGAIVAFLRCRFFLPDCTYFIFVSPFDTLGVKILDKFFRAECGMVNEFVGVCNWSQDAVASLVKGKIDSAACVFCIVRPHKHFEGGGCEAANFK